MNKIFTATIPSFKGKHPEGAKTIEVVVKAKYKKDGIEAAREELKLWDAEHHDKYQTPKLVELEGDEAQKALISYLAAKEKVSQLDLPVNAETSTSKEGEISTVLPEMTNQLRAELATVAEYPIVEPYAVRVAIAKNEDKFIHSMCVVNRATNGAMFGHLDSFNPKLFSDVDSAVVYGLAMAIDACNKYLVDFLDEKQIEQCSKILSAFAQDAEGNFIERYIRDLDMSSATFFNRSNQEPKKSDAQIIADAIVKHPKFNSKQNGVDYYVGATPKMIVSTWQALQDKYGALPVQSVIEHINSMSDFSHIGDYEVNEEILSHYITEATSTEINALTSPITITGIEGTTAQDLPLIDDEDDNEINFYAAPMWTHYIQEICSQFTDEGIYSGHMYEGAANTVSKLLNNWKVKLFAVRERYTIDAETFKEEFNFQFKTKYEALEVLSSYTEAEKVLESCLALSFDDYAFKSEKVKKITNDLVIKLVTDVSHGCEFNSEKIKALIYSEITTMSDEEINENLSYPLVALKWWNELCDSYSKQRNETIKGIEAEALKQSELLALANKKPTKEETLPTKEETLPNKEENLPVDEEALPANKAPEGLQDFNERIDTNEILDGHRVSEIISAVETHDEMKNTPIAELRDVTNIIMSNFFEVARLAGNTVSLVEVGKAISNRKNITELKNIDACQALYDEFNSASDLIANTSGVDVESFKEEWEELSAGSVEPPAIEADNIEPTPYGELLIDSSKSESLPPYERVTALCLQRYENAHLNLNQEEYEIAARNIIAAIDELSNHGTVNQGETVAALCALYLGGSAQATNTFLDESLTLDAIAKCVVFESDEAISNEKEPEKQDFEPVDHDTAAGGVDGANNTDIDPSSIDEPKLSPDPAPEQQATLKSVVQSYMKAATGALGVVGIGWGYEIKRQWETKGSHNAIHSHVEVGIWVKAEGIKGEPISFFGSTQPAPATSENYINDALFMALANGLETVLFSLGVNINE